VKIVSLSTLLLLLGITTIARHEDKSIHILFVGNSLTYTNNLPALVVEEGKNQHLTITTEILAYPNYALEDHWNDGVLQKQIATGNFQFVILQQGPSSQADGRTMLLDYGQRIKNLCDRYNTTLIFLMVWPSRANSGTFDGVIRNYTEAATRTGSLLCPAGKRWKEYIEKTNDYYYYGPDGFHPSLAGSKVVAALVVALLTSGQ